MGVDAVLSLTSYEVRSVPPPGTFPKKRDDVEAFYDIDFGGADYVARVGSLIRRNVKVIGGVSTLGNSAVELARALQLEATALSSTGLSVIGNVGVARHASSRAPDYDRPDMILASGRDVPITTPEPMLRRCKQAADRAVVWVVPADNGCRGGALARVLPHDWSVSDRPMSVERLLQRLVQGSWPQVVTSTAWTGHLDVTDVAKFSSDLAIVTGLTSEKQRHAMSDLLSQSAIMHEGCWRIPVQRRSAVLIWDVSRR